MATNSSTLEFTPPTSGRTRRHSTRKPRLNAERHQQLGKELAWLHNYLVYRSAEILNAYPRTSEAYKRANRVYEQVDRLRWALENQAFEDCPDAEVAWYAPSMPDRYPPADFPGEQAA
jgi:hypothetical protein